MASATFGQRLQELRQEAGLSQAKLAETANLPLATIQGYEQGRREPAWHVVFRLALALGVTSERFADCAAIAETRKRRDSMAQFIQVRGPDPDYKGSHRTMLLAVSAIVRIVPVFVEVANGQNFLCTEDHKGAAILYYKLVDVHGQEYAIASGLLEKIGAAFDLPIPNVRTFKHGDWPNKRKTE